VWGAPQRFGCCLLKRCENSPRGGIDKHKGGHNFIVKPFVKGGSHNRVERDVVYLEGEL